MIKKTYKYRLVLTKEMHQKLDRIQSCCSFLRQGFLKMNQANYEKHQTHLSLKQMFFFLKKLQTSYPFLQECPASFLKQTIIDLHHYVKTTSPSSLPSHAFAPLAIKKDFQLNEWEDHVLIKHIGLLRYKNTRFTKGTATGISLHKKNAHWFLLVNCEFPSPPPLKTSVSFVGIDIGLKTFAYLSSGLEIENPRFFLELEQKINLEQKRLTQKVKYSRNWEKQKKRLQKLHQKVTNHRKDFFYKLSNELLTQYDVIGIESLAIQKLSGNRKLSKSIMDASWGMFIDILKDKAAEKSKVVIEVGRFFPSSQICSKCGNKKMMPVHLRIYCCTRCKTELDRDYNAALNIEKRAKELFQAAR